MARKDVIDYYLKQQNTYFGMLVTVKRLDSDFAKGLIARDDYKALKERILPSIDAIKDEYDRLSYIVLLLNEPKRKKGKKWYKRQNAPLYQALSKHSKEEAVDESLDALKAIKEEISRMPRQKDGHMERPNKEEA